MVSSLLVVEQAQLAIFVGFFDVKFIFFIFDGFQRGCDLAFAGLRNDRELKVLP